MNISLKLLTINLTFNVAWFSVKAHMVRAEFCHFCRKQSEVTPSRPIERCKQCVNNWLKKPERWVFGDVMFVDNTKPTLFVHNNIATSLYLYIKAISIYVYTLIWCQKGIEKMTRNVLVVFIRVHRTLASTIIFKRSRRNFRRTIKVARLSLAHSLNIGN